MNLHNPLPSDSHDDVLPGEDIKPNVEQQTEAPSYSVSNSLTDRLGTDSQSSGQNAIYGRYGFSLILFNIFWIVTFIHYIF